MIEKKCKVFYSNSSTSVRAHRKTLNSFSLYSKFSISSSICLIRYSLPPNNAAVSNAKLQKLMNGKYCTTERYFKEVQSILLENLIAYLRSRPVSNFTPSESLSSSSSFGITISTFEKDSLLSFCVYTSMMNKRIQY